MKLHSFVDIFVSWSAFVTSAIRNSNRLPEHNVVSNLGNLYIQYIELVFGVRHIEMVVSPASCCMTL
jgi:hypothetical protein